MPNDDKPGKPRIPDYSATARGPSSDWNDPADNRAMDAVGKLAREVRQRMRANAEQERKRRLQ